MYLVEFWLIAFVLCFVPFLVFATLLTRAADGKWWWQ